MVIRSGAVPNPAPMNTASVTVDLAAAPYSIRIAEGSLSEIGTLIGEHTMFSGKKVALVTDSNVGPIYLKTVQEALETAGFQVTPIMVPAGEASKCIEQLDSVCRQMLQAGLDRKSLLVALGGGVIGDLAGFAASIFQRGIPCVQVPTTIVSQVDSSVGGKTGINTPEGKNLLGAFHQPSLVVADTATLASLPEREFNEGFAEIIKHAAIRDEGLLSFVENRAEIRSHLVELMERNVSIKARVVEEDERETSGTRALLNFGHTIGHGIEAAGGYGRFLHGEAISLGLVAAARLSVSHAGLSQAECDRIIAALELYDLPTRLSDDISTESILEAMARDKKFEEGAIRFVLVSSLGQAHVSSSVTGDDIKQSIDRLRLSN